MALERSERIHLLSIAAEAGAPAWELAEVAEYLEKYVMGALGPERPKTPGFSDELETKTKSH